MKNDIYKSIGAWAPPAAASLIAAVSAAPCVAQFTAWRTFENALSASGCGMLSKHAFVLAQCSHCWAAAAALFSAAALGLAWLSAKRAHSFAMVSR